MGTTELKTEQECTDRIHSTMKITNGIAMVDAFFEIEREDGVN